VSGWRPRLLYARRHDGFLHECDVCGDPVPLTGTAPCVRDASGGERLLCPGCVEPVGRAIAEDRELPDPRWLPGQLSAIRSLPEVPEA
jgi:hypothetical protein